MKNRSVKRTLIVMAFGIFAMYNLHAQIVGFKMDNYQNGIIANEKDTIVWRGDTLPVYITSDIILYNYSKRETEPKQLALAKLNVELYTNSQGESGTLLTKEIVTQKLDSVEKLQNDIRALKSEQDSLYFEYTKEYISYRNTMVFPGPLRARAFFDLVYDAEGEQFKAMGNTGVNFGNNTASIYSEIVSGNLGLLRVGLGTMVSSSNTANDSVAKTEEAYQRLVTNGGNTILSFEYPWFYWHTNNNRGNIISRFISRGSADFPAFGTSTDKWAGSAMIGFDCYADAALNNNSMRFFGNFNYAYYYGTSVFQSNLGIGNSQFSFGQLTLGLVFLENYKISFIVATLSSEATLQNKKVIAGGQVLR